MAKPDDKKIIFSMVGVSKTIRQTNKQVLKNIYLSFFYGAKIGIIGLNGAGKSTLMKIIAGLDTDYQGEVVFSPGYSVGYLPQDPHLDDDKTVRQIVEEGVADVVAADAAREIVVLLALGVVDARALGLLDDDGRLVRRHQVLLVRFGDFSALAHR